jgi:hypothetical protein
MSDWQFLNPMGVPQPGTPVQSGGGGSENPLAGYRDMLDARRSGAKPFTPNAEYPDGYLGQVNSRREDRLLQAVSSRLTQRNYQRGVHKGDKIGGKDYFWPPEFGPMSGLEAQARGEKWGPVGSTAAEQINHMGKNHMLTPSQMGEVAAQHNVKEILPVDPVRQQKMSAMLPTWR